MSAFINSLYEQYKEDMDYVDNHVTDLNTFLESLKQQIIKYSHAYQETEDVNQKNTIKDYIRRYYDMYYYTKGKINPDTRDMVDSELISLPPIYCVYQKPDRFDVDYSLLSDLDIESGLIEEQTIELLKSTVNNTRDYLNEDLQTVSKGKDVYKDADLNGLCGYSRAISMFPLRKLGLNVTYNQVSNFSKSQHAFGTVEIPVVINGERVNKRYIVDCTYNQFLTVTFNLMTRFKDNKSPGTAFYAEQGEKEIAFTKELLKNGFVEATPENMKMYIQSFLSVRRGFDDIDKIESDYEAMGNSVLDVDEIEDDYTEEYLNEQGINIDICSGEKRRK